MAIFGSGLLEVDHYPKFGNPWEGIVLSIGFNKHIRIEQIEQRLILTTTRRRQAALGLVWV